MSNANYGLSRRDVLKLGTAGIALTGTCWSDEAGARQQLTRYLRVVQQSSDALLKSGRDDFGPQHTGMFLSLLDCRTVRPPEALPAAPTGVRRGDRTDCYGANANLQQNLFLTLQHLSRITGDAKYQQAAERALLDLIRISQNPKTGLLAWGEHLFWDCHHDRPGTLYGDGTALIHEPKRKLMFFDLLYAAEPERTLAFARGLWDHQIADHRTGDFSRHARYDVHGPGRQYDFLKEGSYFIDVWSRAYQRTHDPVYTQAIQTLARRYLGRINEANRIDFDSTTVPGRENTCLTSDMLSLAVESHAASERVDSTTEHLLHDLAGRLDRGFLQLPHRPDDQRQGFVYCVYTDSGKLRPRKGGDGHSCHWGMGYGVKSTMLYAVLCYTRQRQLGTGAQADVYRSLVQGAADLYRRLDAEPRQRDIWAGEYGLGIFVELAALRLTGQKCYLSRASELAEQAIRELYRGDSALPRASTKTNHYESITYSDTLLLALLALHQHLLGAAPEIEISDVDR